MRLDSSAPPLYVYHEIVHNKYVVERFRARGVVFVDDAGRGPRGRAAALQRPRRLAGDPRAGPRAQPAGDRRHLPAGDQGPPRSRPVRPGGLHDRPDRPRRARRGDRHDGRGPATAWSWSRRAEDVERLEIADRREARLPDADDAERGRRQPDHRRAAEEVPADRRPAQGRHLLRHAEPPGGGPRAGAARPTWCWCWAARTARTASGWPRSPTRSGRTRT